MVVVNVPCMNGGGGETSYAKNSNIQRTVISKAWPFLEETIKDMFSSSFPGCFNVADLGCSSGPNTLLVPENLENNKRDIYITKSSPPSVCQAFLEQFQRDFSAFLSLRSEEIVSGGRMFLTFLGRSIADPSSKDCCCLWELLTKSLIQLANEGLVEEADVDSFNMPCYFPYEGEVKSIVREQGSFNLDTFESFKVNWDPSDDVNNKSFVFNKDRCGQNVANSIRAVTEPMLASHFGNAVIDPLFARFATLVAEHLAVEKTKHISLVISMTRKQHAQPDLDI
ncbi:s-adenosyl-l-methionine-dependent methyltransferases superfamily protein [Citrus sinensis]|uniref:S-adenosyl-l-methionine-dependent methyltransferases superfamily protein n=1 Tax=Citrus sinensis TaxID=2711 RepID=A0ACB8K9L9_CITSI|nr:s-adenosyl-l-methionine-dependent methyltransferases superfamily protein [Citrus sinensis]